MSTILRTLRSPNALRLARPSRLYSTEQPPTPTPEKPNPHREFYRGGMGRPIALNFLVAMATFQALYWSWLKLESLEVKKGKGEEIARLEGELRGLKEGRGQSG